jgi:hypothetical protein
MQCHVAFASGFLIFALSTREHGRSRGVTLAVVWIVTLLALGLMGVSAILIHYFQSLSVMVFSKVLLPDWF